MRRYLCSLRAMILYILTFSKWVRSQVQLSILYDDQVMEWIGPPHQYDDDTDELTTSEMVQVQDDVHGYWDKWNSQNYSLTELRN
jgi:hypothetical protein